MIDDDVDTLARTAWAEARGEGSYGMKAVVCSIMNRCAKAEDWEDEHDEPHPLYGDGSPASACKAPYQFSCWNENDPNLPKLKAVNESDALFLAAIGIAMTAVDGKLGDITRGATHYYAKSSPMPPWAQGKTPCAVIGHHLFFNNIA